jgi:NAD(P)-dependent dehydrogenase (short-subunit alcohol dehydrogenase family)
MTSKVAKNKGNVVTQLTGAVVLVTGANGGMGAHLVQQALSRGASKVYATARRPRDWNDERITPLVLDVTDAASVAAAARAASDTTVVVNNAAVTNTESLLIVDLDKVRTVYETNVFGSLAVAQAFAPVLVSNGGGGMIHMLSGLSWYGLPEPYPGTKAAFWSLTNGLRIELAPKNIQVLGAVPGLTETPLAASYALPKNDPGEMVDTIYGAFEAGDLEVLCDDFVRDLKSKLSGPLEDIYPEVIAER